MSFSSHFKRQFSHVTSVPLLSNSAITTLTDDVKVPVKKARIQSSTSTGVLGYIDWDDNDINTENIVDENHCLWENIARPRTFDEVKGQDAAKSQLLEWINAPIMSKAVLLSANSSCGKTSLARTLFAMKGYSIWDDSQIGVDDNIGDALQMLMSRSRLSGTQKRAVLIECAEGILGDEKTKLVKALKSVNIPIIITCDDAYDPHIKPIKESCKLIQLKQLDPSNARAILMRSAHRCGKPLSADSADTLLDASHGNVRQALNSMQFMVTTKHRKKIEGQESALKESDTSWDLFSTSAKVCSGITEFGTQDIASSDLDLALTMLQHNVVGSARSLFSAADALDSLSVSDILMKSYYTDMAAFIGIHSVSEACKGPQRCPRMQFPIYFGKMSSRRSRETHLRTAAALQLPTTGPTLSVADKETSWKSTPISSNTLLQQVFPTSFDSHELIMVHSAKILKCGLKPKAMKDAGLLTDSEPANTILRQGVWTIK